MNHERFRNSPSGVLVQATHVGASYWAFVPHPLPPPLALDPDLWRALSAADRALGELAGLGHTLPNPQLLMSSFIRREAVLSSRIEGTQAGIADLYTYEAQQLALPGMDSSVPATDVEEVLNYVGALEYALEQIFTLPISLRLIRQVHSHLMHGVRGAHRTAGEFRQVQNLIGGPGATLPTARYVPPPPPQMHQALDAFEKYLHVDPNLDYPPLIRLAFIHYQFEAIHPFEDGNGRTGRLLVSLLLVAWRLLPFPYLYLSAFFERHRSEYYDLLFAVSERGAWQEWVLFFLQGVADQAGDAIIRATRLQDLREAWRERLVQSQATASAQRLMESLFVRPIITVPAARRFLEISYPAAKANVERLVQAGILHVDKDRSYRQLYRAADILQIMQDTRPQ